MDLTQLPQAPYGARFGDDASLLNGTIAVDILRTHPVAVLHAAAGVSVSGPATQRHATQAIQRMTPEMMYARAAKPFCVRARGPAQSVTRTG